MPIDPGTATLVATGLSSLLGGLFGRREEKKKLTPEELELIRAQTRTTDAERLATDTRTRGQATSNALDELKLKRRQANDPLWRAVAMMAASRLPIFAQQGFDFSGLHNPISVEVKDPFARPAGVVSGEAAQRRAGRLDDRASRF
jgi:hypothetical protein